MMIKVILEMTDAVRIRMLHEGSAAESVRCHGRAGLILAEDLPCRILSTDSLKFIAATGLPVLRMSFFIGLGIQ